MTEIIRSNPIIQPLHLQLAVQSCGSGDVTLCRTRPKSVFLNLFCLATQNVGPKMSQNIWARPQPLNTPTSVLYVGEFGQHFSVRISFFKKLVDSRATPRKSLGDPKWGRDPEVEKHCPKWFCWRLSYGPSHCLFFCFTFSPFTKRLTVEERR